MFNFYYNNYFLLLLFYQSGVIEGALIMAVVGYLSVTAMLMLIDCKYAILTSGGRSGGRSITMETKVSILLILNIPLVVKIVI